jgi:hypothetical protein
MATLRVAGSRGIRGRRYDMVNLQWKTFLHAAAIIAFSLLAAPNVAWSQNAPQVPVSGAPMQKAEAASKDDRSYLPPSMRGETVATNAVVPVAARADKRAGRSKSARRYRKRNRRYAQGYDSGFGFFND